MNLKSGQIHVLLTFSSLVFALPVSSKQNVVSGVFSSPASIYGQMLESSITYPDGFNLDMLSPTNHTVLVMQNQSPLPASFITGSDGDAATPYLQLSPVSYVVMTSEYAGDLIAQVAIPYSPDDLVSKGIQAANTYVAVLSADKRSWVVDESTRNIQRAQNRTRIEKLTKVTGEYMLVGRQSVDMGNIFMSYGTGQANTVKFVGGVGVQEAEFVDGLRMSVHSNATVDMTVELVEGINPGTLNDGFTPLNTFAWHVKMGDPNQNVDAVMMFPFNRDTLARMRPNGASPTMMLQVGRRALNATSGTFLPFNPGQQEVRELPEDRIVVRGVKDLDGQYLMMVTQPKNMPPS